ncbi:MAG: type II toxin-antitoxin system VapC family toxin [Methanobrevibacter sp. CfCl-M3]
MIFVDTTFILGLAIDNDQWHDNAIKLISKVEKSKRWISNIILTETLNGLTGIMDGKEIENMYNLMGNNYNIYIVDETLQKKAIKITKQYNGMLGYADCTCIAIMEELGIHEIISFDEHFDNKKGIIRIY